MSSPEGLLFFASFSLTPHSNAFLGWRYFLFSGGSPRLFILKLLSFGKPMNFDYEVSTLDHQ